MHIRTRLALLVVLITLSLHSQNTPISIELNKNWQFKQWRKTNWYPATVPGVVHTDLMNNGIIEDPFYRLNERSVQWVDKEDWMYETYFDVADSVFGKDNIRLHFKGIDNYASIYLNGQKILETDNMFREWKVDVKELVKRENNKLEVFLRSPIKEDIPKWEALPYKYPTGPDQSENGGIFDKRISIFARKAGYQYGWDWGPRLVTSGIWRPVFLEAWNILKIEDVFLLQTDVTAKQASISAKVEVITDNAEADVEMQVKDNTSGFLYGSAKVNLEKGTNIIPIDFTVKNPKLWWCNGLGDPNLYSFKIVITRNSELLDNSIQRTGIRSLKLINKPDKFGKSLYFELNGIPVFAKGADYVPNDNFLPRVTHEKYNIAIRDAVLSNMNMLRVWGGGIYEDDYFYDLCDENGIMVWQDFMFACSMWPSEGKFLDNIQQEAIENVKRLRNHPSIGVWCGNNESYDFWFGWGRKEYYTNQNPAYASTLWKQYLDLFHKVLPEVVSTYSPETSYRPSSPFGLIDEVSDDKNGDRHYWGVWHGREPIQQFNVEQSRFFSEYGFQSFPEFESVKIYAPDSSDWAIGSEVMMDHQRAGEYANNLIKEYLLNNYKAPKDFQSFLYMNQVLQGDAIKIALEAHRRDMPYCMGTLYWQFNDCWPVASWSSRDYYGKWKAQQYFAMKAYRDILVSPIANADTLNIFIVSDRLKSTKGKLSIRVLKFDGTPIFTKEVELLIPAQKSSNVFTANITRLLKGVSVKDVFITVNFTDKEGTIYTNNYFLAKQKELNLPKPTITSSIKQIEGGYEVTLSTDKFARAVFISIKENRNNFSDNYFDMLPKQTVSVRITSTLSRKEFEDKLKVVSLWDASVN